MMDPERIKEIFAPFGPVAVKRMFGGAGVYRDGLCFAMEADGDIYLKVDDENREVFRAAGSRPFVYPMKGEAKEMNYWRLLDEAHDETTALQRWASLGFEAAKRAAAKKPAPKPPAKAKPASARGGAKLGGSSKIPPRR